MKIFIEIKLYLIKAFCLLILVSLLQYCTSVRKDYFGNSKKFKSVKITELESSNKKIGDDRFSDTTYIIVTEKANEYIKAKNVIIEQFDEAVIEFDSEQYDSACFKFGQLKEIFAEDDSLYFESVFYTAECEMLSDKLDSAEILLNILLLNKNTPSTVIQKSLVRLGQLYCVSERKKEAEEIFHRLRNDYPDSIYLKIADCSAVGM